MAKDKDLNKLIDETLKSNNIKLNKKQKELLIQIFKFIIVGGIATLIDWIIYFILYRFIHIEPIIANIFSFSISVVYNYIASCKYVFNVKKDKDRKKLFVIFIIFSLIGLGINELLIYLLHNKLLWNAMLVKIIATVIVMVFNFISRKIFLEK